MRTRTLAALLPTLALAATLAGCGGSSTPDAGASSAAPGTADASTTGDPDAGTDAGTDPDADTGAADQSVCAADATALSRPYDAAFPDAWRFPPSTVVYNVEDRGSTGVIVTGISTAPFRSVLAYLNGPATQAGFKVTDGETEDADAEANWTYSGTDGSFTGRWAIRESATCSGETVVQVLATPAG